MPSFFSKRVLMRLLRQKKSSQEDFFKIESFIDSGTVWCRKSTGKHLIYTRGYVLFELQVGYGIPGGNTDVFFDIFSTQDSTRINGGVDSWRNLSIFYGDGVMGTCMLYKKAGLIRGLAPAIEHILLSSFNQFWYHFLRIFVYWYLTGNFSIQF